MKHFFILFFIFWWGTNAFSQVINTFPYTEDFEAEATCATGCGAACATLIDFNNDLTDDLDWLVDVGGTSSGGTGPSVDHTLGTAAGKYLYVETSCSGTGYPNFTANLESPWFDFTSGLNMQLEFWYHALGQSMGNLNVEARIGTLGAWTAIAGPITDNIDSWQNLSICLGPAYSGQDSVQFRWNFVSGTNFYSDIALDDITVSAVNQNDVGVTIVSGPSGCGLGATEVITVEVCNFGDTIPSGTNIPVSFSVNGGTPVNETITLTGDLLDICNGGGCVNYTFTGTADLSAPGVHTFMAWTSLAGDLFAVNDTAWGSVNNIPVIGAFPYYEDFEGGNSGWDAVDIANSSWELGTPASIINGASSGMNAWVTNATGVYNASEDGWVRGPCFDMSSLTCLPYLEIDVWWESEYSWDGMNVQTSVDGGATWQNVGSFGDPNNWYNDNTISGAPGGSQEGWTGDAANGSGGWVTARHALNGMAGQGAVLMRVSFGSDGSVQRDGVAFDNIRIYEGIPFYDDTNPEWYAFCSGDSLIIEGGGEGVPGSIYNWSTNDTTENILVFAGGDYILTRTDTISGCTHTDSVTITGYSIPSVDLGPDTSVCLGTMIDAGPALSHVWSTGDSSQMITIVASDTFWVTASNPACPAASDTVVLTAATPPSISIAIANSLDCYNSTNGVLNALDSGGTGAVTFQWDAATNNQTAQSASGLTGGSYSVTATDALGCSASTSYTLIAPDTLMVDIVLANALDCHDSANGVLNALDSGGTGAVTFQWDAAANNQTAQSASGLTGGTYFVTATDANGCTNVDSFALLTPDSITVLPDSLANVSCSGGSDGVIQVTTLGGTPTYTYLWSNGATTEDLVGIPAGLYSGTITDANGCTFSASLPITEPTQLVASATDLGNGQAANANGSGGTPPYSFQWDAAANNQTAQTASNLTPGTYSVTVTDANGCSDDTTVTILATNINAIAGIGKLNIFPNPASSQIVVDIELDQTNDVAIRIMNVTGQLLFEKQLGAIETQREVLDIRSLVNGVYTVQIHIGAELISKKLIVSKQ